MDPRHPELAVKRMNELLVQYNRIEDDMKKTTIRSRLGQLEREGGLVVQELCLVAPRLHEAMMQTSRQRRNELAHGIVEKPVEKYVEPNQAETVIVEPKPRKKKKATKKKKAE